MIKFFERKIGTDISYLLKGGFLLGSSQAISIASSLILLIAMGKLLSPEIFGKYTYVLSTGAIIGSISLTGLATTVIQAVSRGDESILRSAYSKMLRWSVLAFLISLAISIYHYSYLGDTQLAICFLITGILNPFIASNSLYISYLTGKRNFRRLAFIKTATSITAAAILLSSLFIISELYLLILFNLFPSLILSFIAYRWISAKIVSFGKIDSEMISYSKHLSVMNAFGILSTNIDKIIVFHFLGPIQLAIYAFAIAPVQKLRAPDQIIANLALPKLTVSNFDDLRRALPKKVYILSIFLSFISFFYILTSPLIYKYLLPNYLSSVLYSQVFSLTIIATSSILFTQALTAHSKKKELYIVKTVIPILRILLFLILIPFYKIWGIIFALLIAQVINFFLLLYLFKKPLK